MVTHRLSSIIREASAKSKDGRIDQSDFLNHCVSRTRYSLFTPMEASIIFHFAGRGNSTQRLSLYDFAQLLDPRWKAPSESVEVKAPATAKSFLHNFAHSAYNFGLGGESTMRNVGRRHVDSPVLQVSPADSGLRSCTQSIWVGVIT